MAGTIFGLGLMQQFNENSEPLSGCKLYIYEANTSTPVTIYQDFALSLTHTWPLVADAAGRIPAFWLDDGSYRVRLLDADGNEIFDESSITAIGASSGTGGGGTTVDPNAIFQTGDFLWIPVDDTRTGWVRGNGRTIGSAASGGTERANADVEDLFLHLWENYSDTLCPVTGGRGASAALDWAANKVIATLNMRGRAPFGLDSMGNSAAGVITGGTSAGASGGAETHTLTSDEMPAHDHGGVTGNMSGSTSAVEAVVGNAASSGPDERVPQATSSIDHTHTISSAGGDAAHENMPPYRLGTWFIRL